MNAQPHQHLAEPGTSPRVAVIVPSFNSGRYLADALSSVRRQTLQDWECVVVDDGSSDDTAHVAQRFAAVDGRFRLVRQANRGTSLARNAGIAAASASVTHLAFLDADDAWLPDALEVLLERVARSPGAVGACGLAEYMDDAGRPVRPGTHPARWRDRRRMGRFDVRLAAGEPYTFSSLVVTGPLWPASVGLHRRDVIEQVGGFDPAMQQLQDWDLYLRMSRLGPFVPIDRVVAWYRHYHVPRHPDGVAYYTMLLRWKVWQSPDNTREQRRENQRVWRRLAARWVLRSARAEVWAACRVSGPDARDAWAALRWFTRGFVNGHPGHPDPATTPLIAPFVVEPHPLSIVDMGASFSAPKLLGTRRTLRRVSLEIVGFSTTAAERIVIRCSPKKQNRPYS